MENREKMIQEQMEEKELIEMKQLKSVQQMIAEVLTKEKGFQPEEIEINPKFMIILNGCEAIVTTDFIINLYGISFAVISCVPSGVESWERYVIAFGRAVKDYQIPYGMITDGEKAKIFDVPAGSLIRESLEQFFTRHEADNLMKDFRKIPCPEKQIEREKRIIYAFEGIKCAPKKDYT